ncbi:MAG: hypothetical protein JJE08_04735 [Proteiniphilum sp.]|nr:hypothetical protein [Proteiniphilum sp.]
MKKIVLYISILCFTTALQAQDITTMWPYKYSDFRNGTVYFINKKTLSAPVNVHLLKSTLHYLDSDQVKEVTTSEIVLVQIDEDNYFMRDNQLMRVLSGDSTGFVAELVLADFGALTESGGAYGSSSNVQATRKLSSLEIGGISITNHMELKSNKESGSLLPLNTKYFIVTPDAVYPATKKGIESQLPDNKKDAFKQFLKQNKVAWKRPESLSALLNFFKD